MRKCLFEELKRYEGQPIKVFTDDGRIHKGIELEVNEDSVRIIERCGKLVLIELCHIDAVEEPQMELKRRCRDFDEFDDDDDDDDDDEGRHRKCHR